MRLDEIREKYQRFFEERGHRRFKSDSLVPANDPSLLFTGAGMNQFKDYFLGRGPDRALKRATSCQKCIRTGDIERVGTTPAHHTFFEMLGNFSFGDYFKKEAIAWAWEFATDKKWLGIDPNRMFVSVYTDDAEALTLWTPYVPASRIYKFGAADNFWPANAPADGPNGPCGPCSELYYDFGPIAKCRHDGACAMDNPACKRFVEIWNLVFTQFDRRDGGKLEPLPQRNIDTGMGLERTAAVMQGVWSNFETDLFKPIVDRTPPKLDVPRRRRIADHLRAAAFLLAEGVRPDREGRGYVLRRLIRSAVRDANRTVVGDVVPAVIDAMAGAYPELRERRDHILSVASAEETQFLNTLEAGLARFDDFSGTVTAEQAFMLHGTFGFPIELTQSICAERKLTLDRAGFDRLLDEDRKRARESAKFGAVFDSGPLGEMKAKHPPTEFVGYSGAVDCDARVLDVVGDLVLLDRTPFYGEGGGQAGDTGRLTAPGLDVEITDTQKPDGYYLHKATVHKGTLKAGMTVRAAIDVDRRLAVARNHTGTHMLQAALRTVLGDHVQQAGSVVYPDRLRFDFSHPKALTREEIERVEDLVNDEILRDSVVAKTEVPIDEARKRGAIMFFGDKYGDRVRVVSVGDFSTEVCGGTHLDRAGTIGMLRVVSESSIGTGVRRIEAVTGAKAIELARQDATALDRIARALGTTRVDVVKKIDDLHGTIQKLKAKLKKGGGVDVKALAAQATSIGPHKIVSVSLEDAETEELRKITDALIEKHGVAASILASADGGRPVFIIGASRDAIARGVKAGEIARAIGKGGGRDHQAQAGADTVAPAFDTFMKIVREKLGA